MAEARHLILGRQGERIALRYLQILGYRIIGRNVRLGKDELDLIAYDDEDRTLVFVEVKARVREDEEYIPELNFSYEKQMRIQRAAENWIAAHRYEGGYRIDLIAVAGGRGGRHAGEGEGG